ncbi:DHA2 family efflux MFS transporter permease subunit [Ornithinimicrobium tianjinense]|uniref:MFS transporter n=1 Tax=Ornithinimicrobium tianjinense TaxID=1195761 RepID=A0A917BM60_9MICO|nr:DHA2 family efflux MFS transporter permease subunit [Ornithinimicrobium tianjinense]GGF49196.1 MFS transporter [Ornithinimicrobium tianjinense]
MTQPPAHAAPAPEALSPSTLTVLRTLTVAAFVVILNETVLVNALPPLMDSLHVDERAVQWLSTGFMLTLAVVIPTTGWLLQRLGTRGAFRLAMSLFLLGTTINLLAPTFTILLIGRVVQASGTAVMMPLLMTTLLTLVPPNARGRVMGNVTLAMSVAPALGPAVSGIVLQFLGWRWLFALVLPIALAVFLLGSRGLRAAGIPEPSGPRPRLDGLSVLLSAVGFGALVYGLAEVGGAGSRSGSAPLSPAPIALVVGALGLALFVWRQLSLQRRSTPLLDLRVLSHRPYAVAVALCSVAFMALMGVMILLPLYLQNVRGLSVLQTGLLLMPGGLAMGLMGPRVGRWFDRIGARRLVIPGAFMVLVALAGLVASTLGAPWWSFLLCHVVASIGLALMFTPMFTGGLASLPPHLYPFGSAMIGSVQQVAAAAGTALSIAVLSWRQSAILADGAPAVEALDGGVRAALVVGVVLAVVVAGIALLVRDPAPEARDEDEQERHTAASLG